MDGPSFDNLARRLASGSVTRRGLFGSSLATLAAALGLGDASAATRKRSAGNACRFDADCVSNMCLTQGPTRKLCACLAPADCPRPAAPCLAATCAAGACGTAPDTNRNGQSCGGGHICQNGACVCPSGQRDCAGTCQACCSAADCPSATCSAATCVNGSCGLRPIPGCCTADGACDDGNICTSDSCNQTTHSCVHSPAADNTSCGGGHACCGGVCTDVTTTSNCGACGAACQSGIPCHNQKCGCPDGQTPCNGACVTTCAAGFVLDPTSCVCVCPSGTKRCENICISNSACCTDADCVNAGPCQTAACVPNVKTGLPPGHCTYPAIPDCCTAAVNHCQARDQCDIVTCDTNANICVHAPKSCPGCFACSVNDGTCSFDTCRANNPCQLCDGAQCVADGSLNYQTGRCSQSTLFCFNGQCVGCLATGTECLLGQPDQCCTGFCTVNPNLHGSYICSCAFPTETCTFGGQCCSNCCSGGFCADLTTDLNNCGTCGVSVPAGGVCDNGNPTCTLGFHNDNGRCCAVGEVSCGSYCANLDSDPLNCGSCGTHVPLGGVCFGGQPQCTAGFHNDNGRCCPAGSHNAGDQCCVNGFDTCGGICISTSTDPLNCGSCGHHCPIDNVLCVNGHCCSGANC